MNTIFKYPIELGVNVLKLPPSAKPLTVQIQYDEPRLWVLLDPEEKTVHRSFVAFGTGHPITESQSELNYIGTFQLENGNLIFHLFEIIH